MPYATVNMAWGHLMHFGTFTMPCHVGHLSSPLRLYHDRWDIYHLIRYT
jgi:hypothetical protein